MYKSGSRRGKGLTHDAKSILKVKLINQLCFKQWGSRFLPNFSNWLSLLIQSSNKMVHLLSLVFVCTGWPGSSKDSKLWRSLENMTLNPSLSYSLQQLSGFWWWLKKRCRGSHLTRSHLARFSFMCCCCHHFLDPAIATRLVAHPPNAWATPSYNALDVSSVLMYYLK